MPKTNLYEVAAGRHVEADGTIYQTGDVVESSLPLDRIFRNKFKRPEAGAKAGSSVQRVVELIDDNPEASVAGGELRVQPGDEPRRLRPETTVTKPAEAEAEREAPKARGGKPRGKAKKGSHAKAKAEEDQSLGDEVTRDFDKAGEKDLRVFHDGRHYHVAGKDAPEKALNDEPLTKRDLEKFLNSYQPEE
jgi:hypothetical protein